MYRYVMIGYKHQKFKIMLIQHIPKNTEGPYFNFSDISYSAQLSLRYTFKKDNEDKL